MKNFMVGLFGQEETFKDKADNFIEHFLTEFPKAVRELKLAIEFTLRNYGNKNFLRFDPRRYYKSNSRCPELEILKQTILKYLDITQDSSTLIYQTAANDVLNQFISYLSKPEGGWENTSSNILLLGSFYHFWLGFSHKNEDIWTSINDIYHMLSKNHQVFISQLQEAFQRQSSLETKPMQDFMMPDATPSPTHMKSILQSLLFTSPEPLQQTMDDQSLNSAPYSLETHDIMMTNQTPPSLTLDTKPKDKQETNDKKQKMSKKF